MHHILPPDTSHPSRASFAQSQLPPEQKQRQKHEIFHQTSNEGRSVKLETQNSLRRNVQRAGEQIMKKPKPNSPF
jgi:hypothetical protein